MKSVSCAVRTDSLYTTDYVSSLKGSSMNHLDAFSLAMKVPESFDQFVTRLTDVLVTQSVSCLVIHLLKLTFHSLTHSLTPVPVQRMNTDSVTK